MVITICLAFEQVSINIECENILPICDKIIIDKSIRLYIKVILFLLGLIAKMLTPKHY